MNYVLDTNILLAYLRKQPLWDEIVESYGLNSHLNTVIIPVVVVGELHALAKKNKWGEKKINELTLFINRLLIVGINRKSVIERYAEIDAFSQSKLENRSLNKSARNMGKNDLWIAATASIANAKLITLDADFEHLDNEFLELIKVDK